MNLSPDIDICKAILTKAVLTATNLIHFNIPNWARLLLPVVKYLGLTIACDIQDVTIATDPYHQGFIGYADFLFFSASNYEEPAPLITAFPRLKARAGYRRRPG